MRKPESRRAFTLVELLVVIIIITIVISLVIPAVGKVRRAAKVAQNQQLASSIANAATTFSVEKKRLPGFYSAREMGAQENDDTNQGMPAMLNALMELSGGVVAVGGPLPNGSSAVQVAPFAAGGSAANRVAWFDPKLIGSTNNNGGGYFTPDKKYLVVPRVGARESKIDKSIPDLVDAFGTPLLCWSADETMTSPIAFDTGNSGTNNFARINSKKQAMFYWNANAAYLASDDLGKQHTSQKKSGQEYSLLGKGNVPADLENSLAAVLGNPGFYSGDLASGVDSVLPTQPRGRFIVHAADPDGYFLGNKSKGKAEAGSSSLKFGNNFLLSDGTTVRKDEKGQVTSTDVTKGFEDILAIGGS